ncbi:hypothetical protein GCM10027167_80530 [Nocardia heshunensis]
MGATGCVGAGTVRVVVVVGGGSVVVDAGVGGVDDAAGSGVPAVEVRSGAAVGDVVAGRVAVDRVVVVSVAAVVWSSWSVRMTAVAPPIMTTIVVMAAAQIQAVRDAGGRGRAGAEFHCGIACCGA